jgi:FeS assembly protein IscX
MIRMADTYHWLDVERIAEELAARHPETEPMNVNFLELRSLVMALPGFTPDPSHPANERILETIQMLWSEERDESRPEPD